MSSYNMPPHLRSNRVRPSRRSVSSIFSLRSFDYRSNRFLKSITIAGIAVLIVVLSVL
jgi:hypothetical protein